MAELKGNGLWDDIQSGTDSALDKVLGPSFDYTSSIRTPPSLGVGTEGDIGQLITNARAVGTYVGDLVTGPGSPYGNEVFVETGGMCKAPGGGVIPRWSYIDNKLGGEDALPPNLKNAIGPGLLDGIIPGMFGDIASLNPIKMMNALYMDGVPVCRAITCPVTDVNGTPGMPSTHFMTPEFEQNMGYCQLAPPVLEKNLEESEVAAVNARNNPPPPAEDTSGAPPTSESFSPYFGDHFSPLKLVEPTDMTPYVLWGVAVCGILFFVGNKL
uniref:Uncharacterized protein n=1 Tax=viral metagenome TaxID=1070528 RepID=A0A6C0I7G4_9ZZZZ